MPGRIGSLKAPHAKNQKLTAAEVKTDKQRAQKTPLEAGLR